MSGRHRPSGRLGRRSLRTPIAIGAVVGLLAVAAAALHAVAADAGGCSTGLKLVVAAAPDIAPAVHEAAARWERNSPKVSGECLHVQVNAIPPADVANALAVRAGSTINVAARPLPTPDEANVPTVWIPDSSSWISRMQAISRDAFEATIASVAMSPIVLAMPDALARSLPGGGTRKLTMVDIGGLAARVGLPDAKFKFGLVEPRRDTAGLAGLTMLYQLIAANPVQLPALVGVFRVLAVSPDQSSLLKAFGSAPTLAPMSEQAVLSVDAGSPATPLVAVPIEAGGGLDYPYATIAGKPHALTRAAEMFRGALLSPADREIFSRQRFRAPDGTAGAGFPVGHGVTADPVLGRPLTDMKRVDDALKIWNATVTPARVLTLLDVTASMNLPMTTSTGQQVPRITVLRNTVAAGIGLFVGDSDAGVWAMAAGIGADGKDYREALPIAPLSQGQKGALEEVFARTAPVATNECGLYNAILAAYKEVRDHYRPFAGNSVVVFTDSTNTRPGLDLDHMLRELEKLTDVTRPVTIIVLGLGPDVNLAELNQIATASGGRAFQVTSPDDIRAIAVRALLGV